MVVPAEFAQNAELIEVEGRSRVTGFWADEGFELGSYRVSDVDRDWEKTNSWNVGPFSKSDTDGGYSYRFQANPEALEGRCGTRSGSKELELGHSLSTGSNYAKVSCTCGGGANLSMEAKGPTYEGTMLLGSGHYVVQPISMREGGWDFIEPLGYRVDGERPLAAVEVMHPGRVWLMQEVAPDERARLTCLLAALLLYKPPSDN